MHAHPSVLDPCARHAFWLLHSKVRFCQCQQLAASPGLAKTAHNLFSLLRCASCLLLARNTAPNWGTVSITMQACRRSIRWSKRRGARHVRLLGRRRIHSYLTGVLDCMGFS
ncbi:hypothetical protein CABS03_03648 [Colletotrichum abscissum]|uniref:Uncharacterized protein n=1 Tax=Colletotrichum abscissum TaxID=1671311 RepID=A0A9P9X398_9PEZI|nr:hypothetical protein CABS02_13262 [Colletotrichum abscissum]